MTNYRRTDEEEDSRFESESLENSQGPPPPSTIHPSHETDPYRSDEELEYRHHQSYHSKGIDVPRSPPPPPPPLPPAASSSNGYGYDEPKGYYSRPQNHIPNRSTRQSSYTTSSPPDRRFDDRHRERDHYRHEDDYHSYDILPPPKRYRLGRLYNRFGRRHYDPHDDEFPYPVDPPLRSRGYPRNSYRKYARESSMESMRRVPLHDSHSDFDDDDSPDPYGDHYFPRGSHRSRMLDPMSDAHDVDKALMENFLSNNRLSSMMAADSIQEDDTSSPSGDDNRSSSGDESRSSSASSSSSHSEKSLNSFKSLMNPFSFGFGGIFGSRREQKSKGGKRGRGKDDKDDDDEKNDEDDGNCESSHKINVFASPPPMITTTASVTPAYTSEDSLQSITPSPKRTPAAALEYYYTESVLIPTTTSESTSASTYNV